MSPTQQIAQLLAEVQQLLAPPPQSPPVHVAPPPPAQPTTHRWYAVCWNFEYCGFDPDTIRLEPDTTDDPRFFPQPLLFPWCYLPGNGQDETGILQVVYSLNEQCHWQKSVDEIADILRRVGGCLLKHCHGGFIPNTLPPPRFRPTTVARARSQPQRFTRSRHRSDQLAALADRKPRPLHQQIAAYRCSPPPLPAPVLFVPGRIRRGETEDQLRERVGLETLVEQLCAAISDKWEKELSSK